MPAMAKFVVIVGCKHSLQTACPLPRYCDQGRQHQDAKLRFVMEVARIVVEHQIDFIGEEFRHVGFTIAQELAWIGCRYYANLDIPLAERDRCGIPRDYDLMRSIDPAYANGFDAQREQYMFDRAKEFLNGSTRALILCGAIHTPGLKRLFDQVCDQVKEWDLTKESWYSSNQS